MITSFLLTCVCDALTSLRAVVFKPSVLEQVLEADPTLATFITGGRYESRSSQEALADAYARFLTGRAWPSGGESESELEAFFTLIEAT